MINYQIEGILSGIQPQVVGNGIDTLSELIEEKNKNRMKGIAEFVPDEKMNWFLTRQLSFDGRITVPDKELTDIQRYLGQNPHQYLRAKKR